MSLATRLQAQREKQQFSRTNALVCEVQPLFERRIAQGEGSYPALRQVLSLINSEQITNKSDAISAWLAEIS